MNIFRRSRLALCWAFIACSSMLSQPAMVGAMGNAAPTQPTLIVVPEGAVDQYKRGQRLLRETRYTDALPLFIELHRQHPDDPWFELYERISQERVYRATQAAQAPADAPPPAILQMMGLNPVKIRPIRRSPTPPAPVAEPAVSSATVVTSPVPAAEIMPIVIEEPIQEINLPYPNEIPMPMPQPIATGPVEDLPIQAVADVIEFSPTAKRVVGQGHVHVTHGEMELTCDRAIVFTESRDVLAEGNVILHQPDGSILTGETVYFNFATNKGTVMDGGGEFFPWYGRAPHMVKTSEHTLLMRNGYITTCDIDPPHYRFQTKETVIYLDKKIVSKHVRFYVGKRWYWYLPRYTYSLTENRNKFSLVPGKQKRWGEFLLGNYRYEFNKYAKGNLHWDWRNTHGHGQGVDFKYETPSFGYGIMKAYFNKGRNKDKVITDLKRGERKDRYRLLLRHRWDIDKDTNVLMDVQEYSDAEYRKDFLFRDEFEKDVTPESYALLTHVQPTHTFTTQMRKRLTRFDGVTELLPEMRWELLEQSLQDTQLYYQSSVTLAHYNQKAAHSDVDESVEEFDVFSKWRYAMRWFRFLRVTPKMGIRQTYFSEDLAGESNILRGAFSTGIDLTTKLFRVYDIKRKILGQDMSQMRHVITPTMSYNYQHDPTVLASKLHNMGSGGSVTYENRMTVGLENKIQGKRMLKDGKEEKFDMVRFLLSSPYSFNREGGSSWSSIVADLELTPHPRVRFESDWTYSALQNDWEAWNFDFIVSSDTVSGFRSLISSEVRDVEHIEVLEDQKSSWHVGLGHRYEREARSEMTFQAKWKPHPKWWINYFSRFTFKEVANDEKRINSSREYQFILTRDLHDWLLQMTVGEDRDLGGIFMISIVLKAFPDIPILLEESYHTPKQGGQSSAFFSGTNAYQSAGGP